MVPFSGSVMLLYLMQVQLHFLDSCLRNLLSSHMKFYVEGTFDVCLVIEL